MTGTLSATADVQSFACLKLHREMLSLLRLDRMRWWNVSRTHPSNAQSGHSSSSMGSLSMLAMLVFALAVEVLVTTSVL